MAFNIDEFVKKNTSGNTTAGQGFNIDSFVKENTQKLSGGFDVNSFVSQYGGAPDNKTSQGLYQTAVNSGLKNDADRIVNSLAGEKPSQIFSGGMISDIFDTLNALDYGVVGLLQGKSFSQGIKERSSFTDTLKDKGLAGLVVGTAMDIAVDPLTYVAPYTIVKKVPILNKLVKGAKELAFGKMVEKGIEGTDKTYQAIEGGTKLGNYLASKLVYMQGADPIFRETFERGVKNVQVGTQNIVDLVKPIGNLAPETAAKLLTKDSTGRFIRTPLTSLEGLLKPEEVQSVTDIYNKIDNLGQQAVDLGLLSREKYEENIGEYIKNAYSEYELAKGKGLFGYSKVGVKGIKNRVEGLTPEKMVELGQVDNPAYLLFKSAFDLSKDVENAKMFKTVAEKFGTDVAQEGFTKLPTGQRLGMLAGKYVPNDMAYYLNEVIEPSKDTLAKQLVANFKFFKVVMNPGTHARNIISNKVLNYWKLGMNPFDPRAIKSDVTALKEITKGTGKWSDEARPLGYNLDTFASQEMKNLLNGPETTILGKTDSALKTAAKKLGDLYQAEENQAKLSAYIFQREVRGLNPEDAWKAAESATFNYAQVTPFVRKLRESLFGFPFITFTVKSTPLAAETIVKNPARVSVIGKIKQNIEKLAGIEETERERASEPSYIKNGFYVKLPIKDKEGRSAYFDMTYILPFGDIMSGNFTERGISMKTGLPESQAISLMKKSPFLQTIGDIYKNQNFYGNKIWKESDSSDKQLKDLMVYLTKTIVPPTVADQLHNGYNEKGVKQYKGIYGSLKSKEKENQQRTLMEELLRNVGAKIQPIDADIQETYQEWNKKKALQNLLLESGNPETGGGVMNNLDINYIPK